jgi:hypothetical protein
MAGKFKPPLAGYKFIVERGVDKVIIEQDHPLLIGVVIELKCKVADVLSELPERLYRGISDSV